MTTIPEGFEECPLDLATYVVTAGAGLQEFGDWERFFPRKNLVKDDGSDVFHVCSITFWPYSTPVDCSIFETLGIIPVREIEREPRECVGELDCGEVLDNNIYSLRFSVTLPGPMRMGSKWRIIEILDEENA